MEQYEVDYKPLIQSIEDRASLELLELFVGDTEETRKLILLMKVFLKHGISVKKAIEISMDLSKVLSEEKESKDEH